MSDKYRKNQHDPVDYDSVDIVPDDHSNFPKGITGKSIAMIAIAACALLAGILYFKTHDISGSHNSPANSTGSHAESSIPQQTTAGNLKVQKEITLHILGTNADGNIVIEADGSTINTLDYAEVDKGLKLYASPEYLDTSVPGQQTVIYTVSSDSEQYGNTSKKFEQIFLIKDSKAPSIAIRDSSFILKRDAAFNPLDNIVSVEDNIDKSLVYETDGKNNSGAYYTVSHSVNTKKAGVYPVTVYAQDSSGNSSESSFTVRVQAEERFVANPSGCNSPRTDYDTLYKELEQYGNEYTSPAYATKDEMRMALKEFERKKYPNRPCQVYPGLHIYDGEEDQWIFYDYNPWGD